MTDRADFEPNRPGTLAALVFLVAGLLLFWPILTGQFLAGPHSDQYVAGYGFRLFGAEYFREYGRIPLWNPYLFGGLPFVAGMHGDIFYPTAWLRWVLPTDTAMNLGFAAHIVLAGGTMYGFLRALGVGWGGAVTGGVSYELTGMVASLVSPGHDGKLFVAAFAPLLFLAVLRAVRDGRRSGYSVLALGVGLSLHGHPQLSYYLLVAVGLFGTWMVFLSPDRPVPGRRLRVAAGAVGAVILGFGLYAIQALPFVEYIPLSPRGEGGPSGGWEYATGFSLPIEELASVVLPEFNGVLDAYWGRNALKYHTEYIGVVPLMLALHGLGDRRRRPYVLALSGLGLLFLLVSLGGHTPFYRLWYEVMPLMKKVRAPGMAFFLVAFPLAALAGLGAERLLRGGVAPGRILALATGFAVVAVLGATGVLQAVAEAVVLPERMEGALDNASALSAGSLRLLVLAVLGGAGMWAIASGRLSAPLATGGLALLVTGDLWSVERRFFGFRPPAAESYRDDQVTAAIRAAPVPSRTLDLGVYRGAWLMAHRVQTVLGYHGNELRFFDELLGGKNVWPNVGSPVLLDLYAVRFLVSAQPLEVQGWRRVIGPVPATPGGDAWLYEAERVPPYARVVPEAVRVPEPQIIPTLLDPRFPSSRVVLYSDTATIQPAPLTESTADPPARAATVTRWEPGRIVVGLTGQAQAEAYLLVSENWHPDWRATVDGRPAPALRGDYALLSVPIPGNAREVELVFQSAAYRQGRMVSLISAAGILLVFLLPALRRPRADG